MRRRAKRLVVAAALTASLGGVALVEPAAAMLCQECPGQEAPGEDDGDTGVILVP